MHFVPLEWRHMFWFVYVFVCTLLLTSYVLTCIVLLQSEFVTTVVIVAIIIVQRCVFAFFKENDVLKGINNDSGNRTSNYGSIPESESKYLNGLLKMSPLDDNSIGKPFQCTIRSREMLSFAYKCMNADHGAN